MFKGQLLNKRISLVVVAFALLLGLLLLRSGWIQLIPNKKLSQLKNRLFETAITLKPRRGAIYDRNGKELVISIPSQSLFADPKILQKPYWTAKKLSSLLNIPKQPLLKRLLNKKRRFVWLKRHLSEEEAETIRSWKLQGLYFIKESKRFYSQKDSLSQVLGFTGVDGRGLEGIEKQYDEILRGETQKFIIKRDAKGRPLFKDFSPFIQKAGGRDIHLSIDINLQVYLERELKKAIENSGAKQALGLILSAESFEVLAMANIPNYEPKLSGRAPVLQRRNRTLTDIFEPGSTLKTFTVAGALKQGIKPSRAWPSQGGKLKIGNTFIKEASDKKKFKPFLNLSEILAFSSNVGAGSLALEIGSKHLRKTLEDFGFGAKTGIDFPGEAKGLLRKLPWRPVETATISFGHGVAGTALQTAVGYAVIASGGLLKRPFLLKGIKNPYTGEKKSFKSQTIRRVLSIEEARALSLMLISATEEGGTGAKAGVPGYFVAGKTGTAQKVDLKHRGYKKGEYISSFAGFIPAHHPKFVIYLMIDGAKSNFYASSLVAPLFSRTASYAVRRYGISPVLLDEKNILVQPGSNASAKASIKKTDREEAKKLRQLASKVPVVPDLKGLTLREILREMQQHQNQGEKNQSGQKPGGDHLIHEVAGKSSDRQRQKEARASIKLKIEGYGKLVHSIPSAGKPLPKNRELRLIFN